MAKEEEKDCVELVNDAIATTIDAENETELKQSAQNMEIRWAKRIGKYNNNYDHPISVEFTLKHDADYIIENKSYLEKGIFVDQEYTSDIEYNRKVLLPILRAAQNHEDYSGRCQMDKDKLVIRGRKYTLANLNQLPEDLSPFSVTSKENDACVGFFGALNPLSTFHPAKFEVNDEEFISSEQYIQSRKAEHFSDHSSYQKIMNAGSSLECKTLARNIRNYDRQKWEKVAKDVCRPGIHAKFLQNPPLLQTLLEKTKNKTIVECAND